MLITPPPGPSICLWRGELGLTPWESQDPNLSEGNLIPHPNCSLRIVEFIELGEADWDNSLVPPSVVSYFLILKAMCVNSRTFGKHCKKGKAKYQPLAIPPRGRCWWALVRSNVLFTCMIFLPT